MAFVLAATRRFHAQVVNWAQMHDCYGDIDRVPDTSANLPVLR